MEEVAALPATNGQAPTEMTVDQAMENIAQACAQANGTLQLHTILQRSLQVVKAALTPAAG